MADILELISLIVWLAAGIYTIHTVRRFNKRCDRLIGELEADIYSKGDWDA